MCGENKNKNGKIFPFWARENPKTSNVELSKWGESIIGYMCTPKSPRSHWNLTRNLYYHISNWF